MLNDLFVAIIGGIELAIVKLDPTVGIMVMVGTGGFLFSGMAPSAFHLAEPCT